MKHSPRRVLSVLTALAILYLFLPTGRSQAPRDPYAAHVAAGGPRTPEEERRSFHVPPGFEVQLVAAEPFVRKPININFDARGRLWVTQSVEYPFPAPAGARGRDCVSILEDTNGDGRADEVTTFTGGLNIPIGVLPLTRGALIYSIPYIYRYRDADGDGRADGREVLYREFGHRDTHGMTGEFTPGFDGWVYACHGFSNTSKVRGKDGAAIEMQSGNTYRLRPDGAHLEYFTHGQVNPFGLAFDPLGNLYSCDCHTRPLYLLLRGAYYPSFGKPHDGLGFGPEMMTHDHGSTAIAGVTYYAADHFPKEYRDTLFVGNVVTNRINLDRIEWHGSSPRAIQLPDFLSSDDPWFRPVDIKLGPDGALYVADFYNRIIGHYEVPLTHPGRDRERGRIWRIVYRGPDGKTPRPRKPRADEGKATVAELVADLAHPNLTVRMQATDQLVERGGREGIAAVGKAVESPTNRFQRIHGLWVLERCGAPPAGALLKAAATDSDRGVRVHAMRVLAERRQWVEYDPQITTDKQLVLDGLKDADPFVRRAAAEAMQTHPAAEHVRPLLDLYHTVPADDTHLMHVVRMALREQLRPAQTWAKLPLAEWPARDLRAIADVAPGVPTGEAAAFLLNHLRQQQEPTAKQVDYVYHVARYAPEKLHGEMEQYVRDASGKDGKRRLALLKALQQGTEARGGHLSKETVDWAQELARQLLAAKDQGDVLGGIELCGSFKFAGARDLLLAKVYDEKSPEAQRSAALGALTAADPKRSVEALGKVVISAAVPLRLRERAAQLLAEINRPEAHAELVAALASVPSRLATAIATGLAGSRPGAAKLLDAVAAGKASARLLQERPVEVRLSLNAGDRREQIAKLTQGLPAADERLQQLLQRRHQGYAATKHDPGAGARVFEKNCANCHQLANKGAKVGPQLDGVGLRGVDRLLEDILDPNRNVDQAFRMTTLQLQNGQTVSGLLLREEGQVLVLADAQGKEQRHAKGDVAERFVSPLSPMPSNFAEQIPERDLYDLLAFLLEQQKK